MIICVTAGVIAVLMLQALVLPAVVRWAQLPEDTRAEAERRLADTTAAQEALAALPGIAADLGTDRAVVDRLRGEYHEYLRALAAAGDDEGMDAEDLRLHEQYRVLRLAPLAGKRATVIRLRDERRIDDAVLRQIQARLDIEEVRLSQQELVE